MNAASRIRTLTSSVLVSIACAVLLLSTSAPLPLVWDEGDTIHRGELLSRFLAGHESIEPAQEGAEPEATWTYTVRREGHPPLSGILIVLGSRLSPS